MYGFPGQPSPGYMSAPPSMYPPYIPPAGYPTGMPVLGFSGMPGQPSVPIGAAPAIGRPPFQFSGAGMPAQLPGARVMPGKAPVSTTGIQDSNNDASAWSEHIAENDQRKYWYNKITQTSTFDKPACLKTPEERSIPPCPWKEYATAEGKKYYHNGTETVWDMPEEYRIWSERVEAASKKRRVVVVEADAAAVAKGKQQKRASREEDAAAAAANEPEIIYANREEAVDAFKSLLTDRGIPSAMKFKEVQEICQADKRWNALKSAGDRKQNLAEYQTKKAKIEKDEKRDKSKKLRDAFLLMLAENTQIDANTRWRTAQTFLSSDNRYKAIEDDIEREDIFREFSQELGKKEKEDASKARKEAVIKFAQYLEELCVEGKINRRTVWADAKPVLSSALADVKYSTMSESDMRRALQEHTVELNRKYREEVKVKRVAQRILCEEKERNFTTMLRRISICDGISSTVAPVLTYLSDWRGVKDLVEPTIEHVELLRSYEDMNAVNAEYDKTDDIRGSASRARGRSPSQSAKLGAIKPVRSKSIKDVFESFVAILDEEYRADKKIFKAAMADAGIKIAHDSKCDEVISALKSAVASNEMVDKSIHEILSKREYLIRMYVEDTIDVRIEDYEESRKLEMRFVELLQDYYYRSDHVGISWETAKDDLYKRSAYTSLERSERKRIFDKYMAELSDKLAAKKRPLAIDDRSTGLKQSRSSSPSSTSSFDGSEIDREKLKKGKKEKKEKKVW